MESSRKRKVNIETTIGFDISKYNQPVFCHLIDSVNSFNHSLFNAIIPSTDHLDITQSLAPDFSLLIQPTYGYFNDLLMVLNCPDGTYAWNVYYEKLSGFYWVFPYMIQTKELKKITDNVKCEKDFDEKMLEHFTPDILELLYSDVLKLIQNNHKEMFKQCFDAFGNNNYALCNLGLISIIDDELSFFLKNKGLPHKEGILGPLVKNAKEEQTDHGIEEFILLMVDKCINHLYVETNFNESLKLDENKNVNRHYFVHGKYFSNKKSASLMLLNTLVYLLIIKDYYKEYENSVIYDKSTKSFSLSNEIIKNEIN